MTAVKEEANMKVLHAQAKVRLYEEEVASHKQEVRDKQLELEQVLSKLEDTEEHFDSSSRISKDVEAVLGHELEKALKEKSGLEERLSELETRLSKVLHFTKSRNDNRQHVQAPEAIRPPARWNMTFEELLPGARSRGP